MYEQKTRVGMGHIGADGLLKLGAAADILQNASWFQMDGEKDILAYFAEHGLNMYLVARQIDVMRFPAYGEELTLKAWIYGADRRFGYRNTAMYDAHGDICMVTSATGAFIDLATRHGAKISEEAVRLLKMEPAHPMEMLPRKISLPDSPPQEFEALPVCSYHLDSFGHMNNARYVDMASACLPQGFSPRRVRMEYKRPALLGQKISPRLFTGEGGTLAVTLSGPDGVCCVLEFLG